jgi:hypothetical protein
MEIEECKTIEKINWPGVIEDDSQWSDMEM